MNIISTTTKIGEKDRIDGVLTKEFKFNIEANFAKIILDFIQEGNEIRITRYTCTEKEDNYICSATIILKKTTDNKNRLSHKGCRKYNLIFDNNKIKIEKQKIKRNYDVIGDEKDKDVI